MHAVIAYDFTWLELGVRGMVMERKSITTLLSLEEIPNQKLVIYFTEAMACATSYAVVFQPRNALVGCGVKAECAYTSVIKYFRTSARSVASLAVYSGFIF